MCCHEDVAKAIRELVEAMSRHLNQGEAPRLPSADPQPAAPVQKRPVNGGYFLTARELSLKLRISREQIYRLANAGEIPGYRIGHEWRFELGEVLEHAGKVDDRAGENSPSSAPTDESQDAGNPAQGQDKPASIDIEAESRAGNPAPEPAKKRGKLMKDGTVDWIDVAVRKDGTVNWSKVDMEAIDNRSLNALLRVEKNAAGGKR